ncbi:Dedicator of cytokinesis protein 3 [Portunus trituberculatus]|uniref:Dedicator of cytokinesis protein 3 n=1 Tax=Portunus trituberculatus TaxID=210409 RepID=A0A5B7GHW5_PORTR|nr:Dedicator of cytokinesis protein 3 [Portunus trituberculatus]
MLFSESVKKNSSHNYRRPYGVAVFRLVQTVLQGGDGEVEVTGKLFTSDEKDFWQLHEFIIKKQTNKCNILSNNVSYGLVVSVKMVHGELEQATKENPLLLKNVCVTKKLGFSDVIMPGDVRNDLYVTLNNGEFERGGKSVGKNIEVLVLALDADGHPLQFESPSVSHKLLNTPAPLVDKRTPLTPLPFLAVSSKQQRQQQLVFPRSTCHQNAVQPALQCRLALLRRPISLLLSK